MNSIFSKNNLIYTAVAIVFIAIALFFVVPQLVNMSTNFFAADAEACCGGDGGDGDSGGGGGDYNPCEAYNGCNTTAVYPKCDYLSASSTTVPYGGGSVTLSWGTTDATNVSISGIGTVSADGSISASVSQNYTFVLTATRSGSGDLASYSDTCAVTVTVEAAPAAEPAKCDYLSASATTVPYGGGNVTLSWGTTNATSVSISNVGTVSADGSYTVYVSDSTTFTLTAYGAGGNDSCTVKVTEEAAPAAKPATCDYLTTSATTVPYGGGNVTLSWGTTNATSVSISGIGTVSADGSISATVNQNNTFVLTAYGTGGNDSCSVRVTVDAAPAKVPATCDYLTTSATTVPYGGGNVTLSWGTTNATSVSIGGIGTVSADGSISATVSQDYTFVLTAYGAGGNDTCAVTVTVQPKPEAKIAKCDFLSASQTTIPHGGGNVTLSWGTTNANAVSITGIGTVSADGSKTVYVSSNTTFTLTADGTDGDDTCSVSITKEDAKVAKCDYLSASRTSVPYGGANVTLSWGTTNANSVYINNGVGSVSADGSKTVYVSDTTTFTLTADGTDGDDTCSVTIIEEDKEEEEAPRCDYLRVDDDEVEEGDEVTLTWETTNADYVYINNGVGSVSRDGSHDVRVYDDTTFTLTAEGDNGREDTCTVRVEVEEEEDDDEPRPRCELEISDDKVKVGDEVTLRWETRDAEEVEIEDDRGNTIFRDRSVSRNDDGKVDVIITRDTEFTLNAEGDGGKRTCRVEVEIEDDNVLVLTERDQPKVAGISLTQVPYTGFEAGPVLTFLFYALLTAWAAVVAYMLVIRKDTILGFSLARASEGTIHEDRPSFEYVPSVAAAPANLPTAEAPVHGYGSYVAEDSTDDEATEESDALDAIENYAHDRRVLLSSDALRYVAEHVVPAAGIAGLDQLINDAKASYPTEDGWLVLNLARIETLMSDDANESDMPVEQTVSAAGTLATAIVSGDVTTAYRAISARPMVTLAGAAAELDAAYRAKQAGDATAPFADRSADELKAAVEALTGALDGTYTDEESAVKIAILKAVQALA